MRLFKKKEEKPLIWEREEEYQRAYARYTAADEKLDSAMADGDESMIRDAKAEREELRAAVDRLYALKQDWLKETGALPRAKQKVSADTKVAASITILGIALPPLIENRGIILRNIKEWVQKPKLWRK